MPEKTLDPDPKGKTSAGNCPKCGSSDHSKGPAYTIRTAPNGDGIEQIDLYCNECGSVLETEEA